MDPAERASLLAEHLGDAYQAMLVAHGKLSKAISLLASEPGGPEIQLQEVRAALSLARNAEYPHYIKWFEEGIQRKINKGIEERAKENKA